MHLRRTRACHGHGSAQPAASAATATITVSIAPPQYSKPNTATSLPAVAVPISDTQSCMVPDSSIPSGKTSLPGDATFAVATIVPAAQVAIMGEVAVHAPVAVMRTLTTTPCDAAP